MYNGNNRKNISNNIATITFYHPSSNSFPSSLLQKLTNEIDSLSKNDLVSIIVLKVLVMVHFVLELHLMNYLQLVIMRKEVIFSQVLQM